MMMKIKGIDISYCQRAVDYKKAKAAGMDFAIIRTGYKEKTDDMLTKHVAGCAEAGIKYGFYVYAMSFSVDEAVKEAKHCLEAIKGYKADYPIFYDLEDDRLSKALSKTQITDIALAFLGEIKKQGYYAAIYANPAWLETYLEKDRLKNYDIWLAAWTENPDKPTKYDYSQTMWQWGLDSVDGIGTVDGNLCFADYPAIIAKGGYNKPKTDVATEKPVYDEGYLKFANVKKRYKCVANGANIRRLACGDSQIMGKFEKGKIYDVCAEAFDKNGLKFLQFSSGYFGMYIDQLGDKLFEEVSQKEPEAKTDTDFKVGDLVEITESYAGASSVKNATNIAAIGQKRYITRIIAGANYPYQLGVKKDDTSGNNTTGFARASGVKKS